MDQAVLSSAVRNLAPWHIRVDIRDGIDTSIGSQLDPDGRRLPLYDARPAMRSLLTRIYPEGLQGRSFMDHACNCGAYSFWAKELGAGSTYGYDAREHWVRQAEFLRTHREGNTSDMTFALGSLYDLPALGLPKFDIGWFAGIFYHLPEPITGLKIAADHTRELLYLNTATLATDGDEPDPGSVSLEFEGSRHLLNGIHDLNWFPSGPKVLKGILGWLGFPEVKTVFWRKRIFNPQRPAHLQKNIGRVALVAARQKGLISHIKDAEPTDGHTRAFKPEPAITPNADIESKS